MPAKGFKKWTRQQRPSDRIMKDGRDTDFIVVMMGPTGVGKSTFMNLAAGANVTRVGHDLVSCTQEIHWHIIENPSSSGFRLAKGRRLVLVDTPGFNDTYLDDSEILRRIAVWLASSYDIGMKLGGIVYLYDISAKRLTGSASVNLKLLEKLCGANSFDKIVIGATKWSKGSVEERSKAEYRLKELEQHYWAGLKARGAQVERIYDNRVSCVDAVNKLLTALPNTQRAKVIDKVLRIQQELVDEDKLVPRTDAGKTLNFTLKEILRAKRQDLAEAKNAEQRRAIQKEVDWLNSQIKSTDVGFFQRLKWIVFSSA